MFPHPCLYVKAEFFLRHAMKPIPDLPYPDDEKPSLERLKCLFEEWHTCFAQHTAQLQEHGVFFNAGSMVCDGFYPRYVSQRARILFVGRESRGMSGENYIECLYNSFRHTKKIGKQSLNQNKFASRMLKLTHALINGMPSWSDIPSASKIGDALGTDLGVSFAFMNLSKFSTEEKKWHANWQLIQKSIRLSQAGCFNERQVRILEPDLLITMNLGGNLTSLGKAEKVDFTGKHTLWRLESDGHTSSVIDTHHFSAFTKNDVRDLYQPICELVQRHGLLPRLASAECDD